MDPMVCVGAIAGALGVRGEARIKSFCSVPEAIAGYGPLSSEDGRSFTLRITRPVKEGFAARLSGVETREQAEALRGTRLYAPRDRLPALPDDEFYHADLEGLVALRADGARLGTVRSLDNFGAGDLIEIEVDDGRTLTLPFDRHTVPVVDLAQGRLVVEPPAELLADERVAEVQP